MPYNEFIDSFDTQCDKIIQYVDYIKDVDPNDLDLETSKVFIKSIYLLLFAEFQGNLKLILITWLKENNYQKYRRTFLIYSNYIHTKLKNEDIHRLLKQSYLEKVYHMWVDMIESISKENLEEMPTSWNQLENLLYKYFSINIEKMKYSVTEITPSIHYKSEYMDFILKRNSFAHTSENMETHLENLSISITNISTIDSDIEQELRTWKKFQIMLSNFLKDISSQLYEEI